MERVLKALVARTVTIVKKAVLKENVILLLPPRVILAQREREEEMATRTPAARLAMTAGKAVSKESVTVPLLPHAPPVTVAKRKAMVPRVPVAPAVETAKNLALREYVIDLF